MKYHGLKECLVPGAAIVHSPIFESAIVKIQEIKDETLNFEEQRAVDSLKNEISDESDLDDSENVPENYLKRGKIEKSSKNPKCAQVGILGQPIHWPSMDHRIPIDDQSMVRRTFCHGHRWDHAELPSMGYRNFCQGTTKHLSEGLL